MSERPRGFEPDGEIDRAHTPRGAAYTDEATLRHLRERVFAASWQHLDPGSTAPSAAFPTTLLDGFLNEPLVVTTDADGETRCLSNVCTHRGHLVCLEPGDSSSLRCRYHGRRFHADGTLRSAPGFEGARDFPTSSDDLPRLPLALLGSLAFTSVRPPVLSFDEWIAPIRERLPWFPFDRLRLDKELSRDYEFAANWALYCDNYLEGFHIPYVHPGLNEAIEFGAYRIELFSHGSLQVGMAKESEHCFAIPPGAPDEGTRVAAYYFWLFPNTMLNVYPWGISLNQVVPLAVDRTRVLFRSYVSDPTRLQCGLGAGLDTVELEDEAVVEATQRGISSRLYDRGRYSPSHEGAVHHFHRLLAAVLP